MTFQNNPTVKYNYWMPGLRVFATICVIIIHTSAPLLFSKIPSGFNWWVGNIFDGLSRSCVPIFVMLTGYLFLPRQISPYRFYVKRFSSILPPFLFWSLVYIFISTRWSGADIFSLKFLTERIISKLINGASFHLWYIYLLFWLYLFLPYISFLVKKLTERMVITLIILWGIAVLIGQLIGFSELTPVSFAYYFGYYLGYLIIGYYFSIESFTARIQNVKVYSFIGFVTGVMITILGTYWLSISEGKLNYFFYGYLTMNVCLSAISAFLFFKSLDVKEKIPKIIEVIDSRSYGVYLIHVLVLTCLKKVNISGFFINPIIGVPLTVTLCLSISTILLFLLDKLPFGSYITGSKMSKTQR
jgi:surface polysaccharide O-acyltransferase-like enzyme